MGVYAGPDVSESGLVLALDAGNSKGFDSTENLVLQSSNIGISPTYFSNASGIVVLNTTATTDPNNLFEASSLDNNGNTGTNYVFGGGGITLAANTTYTYSIHIKQGTKPDFQITIDENSFGGKRYYSIFTYSTETITTGVTGNNDGVVIGSTVTKLINGWYRLSLTFRTSTTSVSGLVDMINRFGDTSGTNYVWGRQLEYGLSASPYYPTTSSIKNRGTTLLDLSGRGNTGTLTNGPTYNSSNGGSIVFDGVNDYNSLSKIIDSSFSEFTAEIFFKSPVAGNSNTGYLLWDHSAGNAMWFGKSSTNQWYWFWNYGPSLGKSAQLSSTSYTANSWVHIAVRAYLSNTNTISETNNFAELIVNGDTYSTNHRNDNTGTLGYPFGSLYIAKRGGSLGNGEIGSPVSDYSNVNISMFRIYNRVLSRAEIQQNFNSMRGRFGI